MNSNFAVQLMNTLFLSAMLIIPFVFVFFLIRKIRKKHEENESLKIRIALLEKRVEALEEYIAESE
ncbi:MAG: hypothetical protein Q4A78_11720 [Peptostreptococcaceae bacterium]|nr:hypothetical protein [Peptostreptococcaceae bacterium]